MAIVLKDRVKQTATAPGTGTITLGSVASGFQGFSAIGNGNVTYFAIVDAASGAWEVNYGTYTSSGTTLSRNATPLSSSNAGALVNFTGTVDVFCTYPSEKAIYEETTGNVLIDGGPITVIGDNVTTYTTFSAALGEMYANVNSFAQFYAQNLNDGSSASTDIVAYNDEGDGSVNFIDMGISSSNYSDALYPIFTPSSGYLYNDGGELIIGSATDDVVLFAGGIDTADEAVRIDKTTKNVTTVADVDVGGDLNATGGTFTAAVTTTASMVAPAATEFVTRAYVDEATSNGFHVHTPVLVATTGNLTATYNQPGGAGDGVGATLTNSGAQAALSVDGVALSVGNRVLVYQQTTGLQNGIYTVTTVGSGSTNWVLTRAADANTSTEGDPNTLGGGDYFFVQSGSTQGFFAFICTNTSAIVFGTTAITFNEFSQVPIYTGTAPINVSGQTIALTGTVAATNGGTGTATVATGDLLYGSGTNTWGKLAAGAGYKSLVMNAGGTNVEWNAVALDQSGSVSGALPATNGGTGLSTYTLGDTVYSSAANTLAKLAGNTTTTKKFLVQTGTGSVSAAPEWGTVSGSDVSGNISGSAGSVANALTLGTYLTGTSFNGSSAVTATVDATSANTASKVVARDSNGDFSAGTITATLSGAATSATTATNLAGGAANRIAYQTGSGATGFATAPSSSNTYFYWNGSAFAWGAVTSGTVTSITAGTYLTGGTITTSGTLAVDATSANTASKVVARDASGNFSAGTITATLNGNASTATNVAYSGLTGTVPTWNQNTTGTASNITAYTINQSVGTGNSPTFADLYVSNWFRNNSSNTGLYNQSTTQHLSSNTNGYWDMSSTTSISAIRFYTGGHVASLRGYVYADSSSNIGFLNSTGSWSFQVTNGGNATATGNVTAYSDERLKKDWAPVQKDFVAKLAKVKSGTYTRIDIDERQAGVGAQSFQALLPETILENEKGTLSVAYGNAAMVSAVELAKDNIELRARIEKLEALVAKLIEG